MTSDEKFARYQDLQRYVGWTDADADNVQSVAALLDPHLGPLVEDFYAEIERHPDAARVITGGPAQVARLKETLIVWLQELLRGPYDEEYVTRRWQVGWRHVEIGLDQVYTNAALSRLRRGVLRVLSEHWPGEAQAAMPIRQSLNTLLDLDLAIIEDAYQAEYLARQQRVERLATIGQVGGGVAHELRNPLNVIKTSIYYLLNSRNLSPEKQAEHLNRIERQVRLADGVITALSNYAKMSVPTLLSVFLPDLVNEVLTDLLLPAVVQVERDWPAALPAALADPGQLKIVLANLVRNACDAMPQGGRLTLGGHCAEGCVSVTVSDSGVGIPPEQIGRIMEPLFTTKAKGLGLGLALSRAILDKHRGKLSVVSEMGKGTTFTVTLRAVVKEST